MIHIIVKKRGFKINYPLPDDPITYTNTNEAMYMVRELIRNYLKTDEDYEIIIKKRKKDEL